MASAAERIGVEGESQNTVVDAKDVTVNENDETLADIESGTNDISAVDLDEGVVDEETEMELLAQQDITEEDDVENLDIDNGKKEDNTDEVVEDVAKVKADTTEEVILVDDSEGGDDGDQIMMDVDDMEVVDEVHEDEHDVVTGKMYHRNLIVYPFEPEDLLQESVLNFLLSTKSDVIKFVGKSHTAKQGIINAAFRTPGDLRKASEIISSVELPSKRKLIVKSGVHIDRRGIGIPRNMIKKLPKMTKVKAILRVAAKEVQEMTKVKDDDEPVTVFVNNIPRNTCENMLKFLFPSVKSIQLPTNSQGATQGYGILQFSCRGEAREIISRNRLYKAYIGANILKLHIVGEEEEKEKRETPETVTSNNKRKHIQDKADQTLEKTQSVQKKGVTHPGNSNQAKIMENISKRCQNAGEKKSQLTNRKRKPQNPESHNEPKRRLKNETEDQHQIYAQLQKTLRINAEREVQIRLNAQFEAQQMLSAQRDEYLRVLAQKEEEHRLLLQREEQRRLQTQREEQRRLKILQEERRHLHMLEEEQLRLQAQQKKHLRLQAQQEEHRRIKSKQEEQRRKQAQQEEQRRKQAQQEEQRRKQAQQEKQRRLQSQQEQRRLQAQQEEQRRLQALQEQRWLQAQQEEQRLLQAEEEQHRLQAQQEEQRRLQAQQEEQRRLQAQQEELRQLQAQQEELRQMQAQQEEQRLQSQRENQRRLQAQGEEHRQLKTRQEEQRWLQAQQEKLLQLQAQQEEHRRLHTQLEEQRPLEIMREKQHQFAVQQEEQFRFDLKYSATTHRDPTVPVPPSSASVGDDGLSERSEVYGRTMISPGSFTTLAKPNVSAMDMNQSINSAQFSSIYYTDRDLDFGGRGGSYEQTSAYPGLPTLQQTDVMSYAQQNMSVSGNNTSNMAVKKRHSGRNNQTSGGMKSGGSSIIITNLPHTSIGHLKDFMLREMTRRYICSEGDNPFIEFSPGFSRGKASVTVEFVDAAMAKYVSTEMDGIDLLGSRLQITMKPSVTRVFVNTSHKKQKKFDTPKAYQRGNARTGSSYEVFVGNVPICTSDEFRMFFYQSIHQQGLANNRKFDLKIKFRPNRHFQFLVFDDKSLAADVVNGLFGMKFKDKIVSLQISSSQ